ncbi:DMT family transporter [Halobacterium sp. CBA1126]|uniref:DMT family transporter n=1 Tax=Halobacterium sp. CBA1126 TaxID=2668074 RepID=UPI0012F72AA4|nr:DMT family transporter [Halobacterium sp. CBA1126]MUV61784.1 EamA family transporter [Halobacterium sp. CBA1126]
MTAARYLHAGLFVLLAFLWGFSFVAIKTGLDALPPVFFAALRFDVAVPLLLGFVAWRYDVWVPQSRADYAGVAVGAVALIAGNNGFLFVGQQAITPAAASVMYGLNPILAPAFAFVLLDQRLDAVSLLGIAVGLVGVVIIVQPSPETLTAGSTVGQLSVLAAAASVALGSVLLRRVDATLDSIPLTAWAMALGAALLHVVSAGVGESTAGAVVTTDIVAAVLVLGVLSTALAYPIYFVLVRNIGPVRTNLVAYAVPVFAAITSWVLFGTGVTPATALGFLVVVTGVAVLERQVVREELGRAYRRLSHAA